MTSGPHVVVAVPARDEEQRIGAALAAIAEAARALAVLHPGAGVTVVVAADACTDATAGIAAAAGAHVVVSSAGRVGAARSAAVRAGLALRPAAVWIASTDADSEVPPEWLTTHVAALGAGVDLLLGSVRPDGRELEAPLLARWRERNPPSERHRFVHGANLGVRVATYREVGGFADLDQDEDVDLAGRCRAAGARVRSTDVSPVLTSARRAGRSPGGFSGYLRALDADEARASRNPS